MAGSGKVAGSSGLIGALVGGVKTICGKIDGCFVDAVLSAGAGISIGSSAGVTISGCFSAGGIIFVVTAGIAVTREC